MSDFERKVSNNPVEYARGVIFSAQNEVLLLERAGEHSTGLWECPGDVLDLGESFEMARYRAIYEKTGLEVIRFPSPQPDFVIEYGQRRTEFSLVRVFGGELRLNPQENSGYIYADPRTVLDRDLAPDTQAALKYYAPSFQQLKPLE